MMTCTSIEILLKFWRIVKERVRINYNFFVRIQVIPKSQNRFRINISAINCKFLFSIETEKIRFRGLLQINLFAYDEPILKVAL